MKFTFFLSTSMACLLVIGGARSASAAPIVVNSGDFVSTSDGEGGGRAQGIQATSAFSISSLGIFGDLELLSFDVVIYASTNGSDVGAVLETSSAIVGGTGNGWNDIPINFSFIAGSFYVVNWRPTIDNPGNWANTLDFYDDSALPVDVGPITLLEGIEGFTADNSANAVHASFRYDIVAPEPASVMLFGLGVAGLCAARRWRQRRQTQP